MNQNVDPGLRTSRRSPHTVPLQMASLTLAARRPLKKTFTEVSSLWANWNMPAPRPRLVHVPAKRDANFAGVVPAIRLSTVLAACGPSCEADAQHIRNG